ncbi:MAG: serine--tRNA ligase [Deltaproteobacteria bacterium]|nr:MAG: serine--tRNA ligase [Deltaproteobacteria bacterium]
MLDLKTIRQDPSRVIQALETRGETVDIEALLGLDRKRRELIQKADVLKARRNAFSQEIARSKAEGKDHVAVDTKQMREISETIKGIDSEIRQLEEKIKQILLGIPNIPHESVPIGKNEEQNRIKRHWGDKPEFDFIPRPHWELGESLGILDFKRAAKLSGTRFCLYWGMGARLERALITFMLDVHTKEHGYIEVLPPFMVSRETMTATGQLPKFEDDLFSTKDQYYLIPTAEVPVTNIFRAETINEEDLPIKLVAFTPCFRREAGSYGKDTRGLTRQHQFNKVELVRFAHPSHSYEDLEELTSEAEEILRRLNLHYRVVTLCTGDLGFSASKTYDLEVWMPGQNRYVEISSCSNFEDFQARRARIRFASNNTKKTGLCHTLNGSGLAVGRTLAAILENYQLPDGSVEVPDVLKAYMGLDRIEPIS